jgi:citrate lyase subunit beta / citryl-CoA lyase
MAPQRGGPRYRSILVAAPQHVDWLLAAKKLGADGVMIDLEDMVPLASKREARAAASEVIDQLKGDRLGRFVRINGWHSGELIDDLLAITTEGLDGVALPKVEAAHDIKALDMVLGELERARHLPVGSVEIIPLAETASGMYFYHDLVAASPRVKRAYGVAYNKRTGDAAQCINLKLSPDGTEWIPIGVHILLAARAAGVAHIFGGTAPEPDDLEAVRRVGELSRIYGANSAFCVHPSHIPIINEIYSPTQEEIDHARAVLATASQAAHADGGSPPPVDGEYAGHARIRAALDIIVDARDAGIAVGDLPDIELQ